MSDEGKSGKSFPPGSPEDLRLTLEILQEFFAAKLKAADLHQGPGAVAEGTANTLSVCHVDGTTDGDPWKR